MRIKKYMSEIGKKGGAAGVGKCKVRGDSEYYKKISKLAAEARNKRYVCPETTCDWFNDPDECPHGVKHKKLPECFKYHNICPNCVEVING